jgi:hypothetical protein
MSYTTTRTPVKAAPSAARRPGRHTLARHPLPGHAGKAILVTTAALGLTAGLASAANASQARPAWEVPEGRAASTTTTQHVLTAQSAAPVRPTATRPQYWSISHASAAAWGWWWYGDNGRLYVSGNVAHTKDDGLSAVARLVFRGNHTGQRREEDPSVSGVNRRKHFNYNSKYGSLEVQACTHGYYWYWSCSGWQWVA